MNRAEPNRPPGKGWTYGYLLVATVIAGLFALQRIYDYDIWWHLRTGAWIVANRAFPQADPFSFATADAPWIYAYGLADPLFYLLHEWAGIAGLQLFTTAVIVGAVGALFLFAVQRGLPPFAAGALLVWVVQVARFRFLVRPLVFKFAGIVFLFWFFFRRDPVRFRYPMFFFAVLLWNWLYPAAFLAQLFAAFLLAEKCGERLTGAACYRPGDCRDALILLGLASVALLLNPNGFELYRAVYGSMFADYATGTNVVEEQQALVWTRNLPFTALVALAGASFAMGRRNFRLLTLLIYVTFIALAWGSVRYAGLAAFAMAGIIAVNLAGRERPAWLPRRPAGGPRWNLAGLALLAAGGLLVWNLTFGRDRVYEFGLGVNRSRFPFAAARILNDLNFAGNIYNSWKYGGFLQWHVAGARTFIDGRCLPAQLDLYNRFMTIDLHAFSRYLAEHQVKAALVDRREVREVNAFAAIPGFRQVHADDLAVLFVRDELLSGQAGPSPGRYRYLRLGGYEYEYLGPLAVGQEAAQVEAEIHAAIKAAPESFFENFLLGYYYEARKDPRAARQYLVAARKNPGFAFTHFNLGSRGAQAALKAGQWAVAEEIAAVAIEHRPSGELYFQLGAARHKLQKLAEAEQAYRASLAMAGNNLVRLNLGFLLLDKKDPQAALDAFREVADSAEGRPEAEQALYGQVLALRMLGRGAEADEVRKQLAARYPASSYGKRLGQ